MPPDEESEDIDFPPDIYDQEQIDLRKLEFNELYNNESGEPAKSEDDI